MVNKPSVLLCKIHDVCRAGKHRAPSFERKMFVMECSFDKLHQTESFQTYHIDCKKKGLLIYDKDVVIVEFRRNAKKPEEASLVPVLPVLHTTQYKANYATSALTGVYFKANDFAVKPGRVFFVLSCAERRDREGNK